MQVGPGSARARPAVGPEHIFGIEKRENRYGDGPAYPVTKYNMFLDCAQPMVEGSVSQGIKAYHSQHHTIACGKPN